MVIETEIRAIPPPPAAAVADAPRPPLVLLADDQEWSARALESVLAPAGFAVLRCTGARQVLEQAHFIAPDLLVVRADLAPGGAASLLEQLRTEARLPPGTAVFVTTAAPLQRGERLALLAAGAWDVVHLPLDGEELLLRMATAARAKFETDRVRQDSLLDAETGLYSVQGLLRRVRELGYQAMRHPAPLACAVLAPEPAGDEDADERGSARLARLVAGAARRSDVAGRVSRSEFAVLAPDTGTEGVLLLAQRLLEAAAEAADGDGPLRVRVGCCALDHPEGAGVDPVELLVRATMALRRAQRDPADSPVCLYDETVPIG